MKQVPISEVAAFIALLTRIDMTEMALTLQHPGPNAKHWEKDDPQFAEEIRKLNAGNAEARANLLRAAQDIVAEALSLSERLTRDFGIEISVWELKEFEKSLREKKQFPNSVTLHQVVNSFILTLSRKKVWQLNEEYENYYDMEDAFGPDVAAKFPSAVFEISEAARCIALDRGTAAVFHLMRVLEIAVKALARCLGIDDPTNPAQKSWALILREIKKRIDDRWNAANRMSGDGHIFELIYFSLDAAKNPIRNATMHVGKAYSVAEAVRIWHAVDSLMRRLAERCDEEGSPPA